MKKRAYQISLNLAETVEELRDHLCTLKALDIQKEFIGPMTKNVSLIQKRWNLLQLVILALVHQPCSLSY